MRNRKLSLSNTHILLLSFLIAILIGAILLSLPISSSNGEFTPFIDALFTSTTATCVTGLVVVPTFSSWSLFGQIVILFLIQIGGLGVITAIASVVIFLHKKIGLSNGMLLQDVLNIDTLSDLGGFIKKVVCFTLSVECLGALFYMIVFIPEFGAKGIWISVFTSISAFCNAGIDIIAENSLCNYVSNPVINITTCLLIVCGGLGYIVWFDIFNLLKERNKRRICFSSLSLHSKITIISTLFLIIIGAVFIFVFEYNNNSTIGNFSLFNKIQASLFQSITTRTAGFATVPQENLTSASSTLCLLLMFIGGSPVGTAGGIKTVTLVVVIAFAFASIKNQDDVNLFNRRLSKQSISKSIAVLCMSFIIAFISTILLVMCTQADFMDILYETISAGATVGLTKNLTPYLNDMGKIIIIATMYLGRVGPISLASACSIKRKNKNIVRNPEGEISVG